MKVRANIITQFAEVDLDVPDPTPPEEVNRLILEEAQYLAEKRLIETCLEIVTCDCCQDRDRYGPAWLLKPDSGAEGERLC